MLGAKTPASDADQAPSTAPSPAFLAFQGEEEVKWSPLPQPPYLSGEGQPVSALIRVVVFLENWLPVQCEG